MVMVLHSCAASNNHSTILWEITKETHASIPRKWLNLAIHVYNSMIVSTQHFLYFSCFQHSVGNSSFIAGLGAKYSTCTWYLYLSTYLSVLDVLEYLVYIWKCQSTCTCNCT